LPWSRLLTAIRTSSGFLRIAVMLDAHDRQATGQAKDAYAPPDTEMWRWVRLLAAGLLRQDLVVRR
jgi:hypothetical protein